MDMTEQRLRGVGTKFYYVYTTNEKGQSRKLGEYKELSPKMAEAMAIMDNKLSEYEKEKIEVRS